LADTTKADLTEPACECALAGSKDLMSDNP